MPHAGRLAVAAVLTVAATAACSSPAPAPKDSGIQVARGRCGVGWDSPKGGDQTIDVHNTDSVTMEVDLVDPASHGVYAEIESLAPGRSIWCWPTAPTRSPACPTVPTRRPGRA
jgi:hypothetical protein